MGTNNCSIGESSQMQETPVPCMRPSPGPRGEASVIMQSASKEKAQVIDLDNVAVTAAPKTKSLPMHCHDVVDLELIATPPEEVDIPANVRVKIEGEPKMKLESMSEDDEGEYTSGDSHFVDPPRFGVTRITPPPSDNEDQISPEPKTRRGKIEVVKKDNSVPGCKVSSGGRNAQASEKLKLDPPRALTKKEKMRITVEKRANTRKAAKEAAELAAREADALEEAAQLAIKASGTDRKSESTSRPPKRSKVTPTK